MNANKRKSREEENIRRLRRFFKRVSKRKGKEKRIHMDVQDGHG